MDGVSRNTLPTRKRGMLGQKGLEEAGWTGGCRRGGVEHGLGAVETMGGVSSRGGGGSRGIRW